MHAIAQKSTTTPAQQDFASGRHSATRKPYQTLTRDRAAKYARVCKQQGKEPVIAEMVRLGIGANRASARRLIRFVLQAM